MIFAIICLPKKIKIKISTFFPPAIDDEVENINMAFPTPAKMARDEAGITV